MEEKISWPVTALGILFGAGGLGGLWAYLTSRSNTKNSPPATLLAAAGESAEAYARVAEIFGDVGMRLVTTVRAELDTMSAQMENFKHELADCQVKHEQCHEEMHRVRAQCDARVDEVRRDFEAYKLSHPPAEYAVKDLQRPLG